MLFIAFLSQLQCLGEQGRVEETHNLMMKLEQLERERDSERMASSNSAPKVLHFVGYNFIVSIFVLLGSSWI